VLPIVVRAVTVMRLRSGRDRSVLFRVSAEHDVVGEADARSPAELAAGVEYAPGQRQWRHVERCFVHRSIMRAST